MLFSWENDSESVRIVKYYRSSILLQISARKPPNVGAGACGIWGHREEAQRPLHETMRLAEARLERHAPGGSMPSEAPKHCKIQSRRDAPKMAILEAPCAQNAPGRSTMRPPEALLPRNPTWGSPHFSGLTEESKRPLGLEPPKREPPDLKTNVDVSKVDVTV